MSLSITVTGSEAGRARQQYGVHGTPGIIIVDRDRLIRFDLYDLPRMEIPQATREQGRGAVAAYMAPYRAAEIRRQLDAVL